MFSRKLNRFWKCLKRFMPRSLRTRAISLTTQGPVSRVFGFNRGTPIDRYYIESFLRSHAALITGSVLEIADSTYTKKFATPPFHPEILHFEQSPHATIIGDLTQQETLPHKTMNCFICTQTLNFIYDIHSAMRGARYLLKDTGVLLATVSGLAQISRYDMDRWGDYWRLTDRSLARLAEDAGFSKVQVVSYGNAMAASAFIQGLACEDLPVPKLLDAVDPDYPILLGLVAHA